MQCGQYAESRYLAALGSSVLLKEKGRENFIETKFQQEDYYGRQANAKNTSKKTRSSECVKLN